MPQKWLTKFKVCFLCTGELNNHQKNIILLVVTYFIQHFKKFVVFFYFPNFQEVHTVDSKFLTGMISQTST